MTLAIGIDLGTSGIKAVLMRKKVQDVVSNLRKQAKIEIVDPDLKKLQEMGERKIEELKKKKQSGAANSGDDTTTGGKQDLQSQQ